MYSKGNGQLSEEDCYDLFIESILYVLNHKRWLDEDSSLKNKLLTLKILSSSNTL